MALAMSVEVRFHITGDRYVFESADGEILISHSDRDEATALFIKRLQSMDHSVVSCRVEAWCPLGPCLKLLRDANAIVRTDPQNNRAGSMRRRKTSRPATPPPVFLSWADYLARTSERDRLAWCRRKARKANHGLSPSDSRWMSALGVWAIVEAARGRCVYCRSLAVERAPSDPTTGSLLRWGQVGRRIGSLEHVTGTTLAWCCMWCNTWPHERRPLATDHGGYHPED